jgi:hypothetical protein
MTRGSNSGGFIWMVDASIGLGAGKILAVLAVKADHYSVKGSAPSLKDVHCIAVGVAASWTGEAIAEFLLKSVKAVGRPVAFLKDGGRDLAKGVKILGEHGYWAISIDDASHVIANLLKREYGNNSMFETFISACGKVSKKLKQTILACLAPPKVSIKARFMNIHRLVEWADRLLKHSPKGRAAKGSLLEKLRGSLDQLPACKLFIRRFLRDATPLLKIQKILKNRGLGKETVRECKTLLQVIPPSSPVRIGMEAWMDKQLSIAEELGLADLGLPITSDSIESLFGVAKTHGSGAIKDANRIASRIPAMCGSLTMADAQAVLNVSVKEQNQILGNLPSLIKQRRDILPNPGNLEKSLTGVPDHRFEMIGGSEIDQNNRIKHDNSTTYRDIEGVETTQGIDASSCSASLGPGFAAIVRRQSQESG